MRRRTWSGQHPATPERILSEGNNQPAAESKQPHGIALVADMADDPQVGANGAGTGADGADAAANAPFSSSSSNGQPRRQVQVVGAPPPYRGPPAGSSRQGDSLDSDGDDEDGDSGNGRGAEDCGSNDGNQSDTVHGESDGEVSDSDLLTGFDKDEEVRVWQSEWKYAGRVCLSLIPRLVLASKLVNFAQLTTSTRPHR